MHRHEARALLAQTYTTRPSICLPMHALRRAAAPPKASPSDHQPVTTEEQQLQQQHLQPNAYQHHHSKQHAFEQLDATLEQLGGGRFQLLLLSCICLFWAGDAAEVMVLSYLGPAVSTCQASRQRLMPTQNVMRETVRVVLDRGADQCMDCAVLYSSNARQVACIALHNRHIAPVTSRLASYASVTC